MYRQRMPIEQVDRRDPVTVENMKTKIILADSQAIYRAGAAKLLAMDQNIQIVAQCGDVDSLYRAITASPGSVVIFSASLRPVLTRLRMVLETCSSRGIVVAKGDDSAWAYLEQGFSGVVFRDATGATLLECVRRVASGDTWLPSQPTRRDWAELDMVGRHVLDRLTRKQLRIVPLIVLGCTIREIATQLKATEQAVKHTMRSIYQTTGTNDRVELALFAMRHPALTTAIAGLEDEPDGQERSCSHISMRGAPLPESWGPFHLPVSGTSSPLRPRL